MPKERFLDSKQVIDSACILVLGHSHLASAPGFCILVGGGGECLQISISTFFSVSHKLENLTLHHLLERLSCHGCG